MQELIDDIRFTDKECYATMFNEGIFKIALEKEKEQIIDAYLKGYIHYLPEVDSKEYYNQTYNQKQHIIDIMKSDEDDDLYNQIN
jgi:hypothetical protein